MTRNAGARGARLRRALLGVAVACLSPVHAEDVETTLQAAHADRLYVLTGAGSSWFVTEDGGATIALPGRDQELHAIAALDSGWLVAGDRPAADGRGREIVLLHGEEGRLGTVAGPTVSAATITWERPLVENGRLVGLAWLEGNDAGSLGVRAASWSEDGFSAPEWVSAPGPGSQLALSAAVLDDGSWLLLWSAFDGVDDEILYSARVGGAWTKPTRLSADNKVPDITPAVAATPGGAVAAWSRYDGANYRLWLARWSDGSWTGATRVGGPGSVFPFFVTDGSPLEPRLVFADAGAQRWHLLGVSADGRVVSRTRFAGPLATRPLVRLGGARPRLEWLALEPSPPAGAEP